MEKRRRTLRSNPETQVKAVLAAALLWLAVPGIACELPAGGNIVDAPRYSLVYRTQPERISVGEHFALDFSVCPKDGRPPPGTVKVDAWMPAHRHGMNYKAEVSALGGGKFRAVGLMFHMPGLWQFLFDIDGERIADSLPIE
jgi:YtkA-like protein